MTALLANIFVNSEEKFEDFKVTISDLKESFTHAYVMFRGSYSKNCMDFFQDIFHGEIKNYQHLSDKDWIKNTYEMISEINQKSVLIYLEDHRLISNKKKLNKILLDFENFNLDYLSYSFFEAGKLESNNLLPLNPVYYKDFDVFNLTKKNADLLNKISPNYYIFSLPSIVSLDYLKYILNDVKSKKIYYKYFSIFLTLLFPFPKYRDFINSINNFFQKIEFSLNFYPINTPFNTEKRLKELAFSDRCWKIGVLHEELFANSDDDNGAYGSSLIKKGLYPFSRTNIISSKPIILNKIMEKGDERFYRYYSQSQRIYNSPVLIIKLIDGNIKLNYEGNEYLLNNGMQLDLSINKGVNIKALTKSEVSFIIYDEVF